MIYTKTKHYTTDTSMLAACGKYGPGDYTDIIEEITCKLCLRSALGQNNKEMVRKRLEQRERMHQTGV